MYQRRAQQADRTCRKLRVALEFLVIDVAQGMSDERLEIFKCGSFETKIKSLQGFGQMLRF
jgi:hypothetical protein